MQLYAATAGLPLRNRIGGTGGLDGGCGYNGRGDRVSARSRKTPARHYETVRMGVSGVGTAQRDSADRLTRDSIGIPWFNQLCSSNIAVVTEPPVAFSDRPAGAHFPACWQYRNSAPPLAESSHHHGLGEFVSRSLQYCHVR